MKKALTWFLLLTLLLTACAPAAPTQGTASTQPTTVPQATVPTTAPTVPTTSPEPLTPIPAAEEPSIQIHYRRNAEDYEKWGFWIWQMGAEGDVYEMNYRDEFGGVAVYPLSAFGSEALTKGIGIIPRLLDSWTKDGELDRVIAFSDYKMDENNYYHFYIQEGDIKVYMDDKMTLATAIDQAYFATMNQIRIRANDALSHMAVYEDGVLIYEGKVGNRTSTSYTFPEDKQAEMGKRYEVEVTFSKTGEVKRSGVSMQSLYTAPDFNEQFFYDGRLGAIYSPEETTFRVWSPVSFRMVLKIYASGHQGEAEEVVEMTRGDKGVFSTTLTGDYAGKYYTYTVYNSNHPNGTEIVDPYAKSAGLSGIRGQIVDFGATDPAGWEHVSSIAYDRKELVVWETHVADVTSSKTWQGNESWRKKFLGMTQSGTTYTENGITVTTGFDHIKELGVNAVQLIPIFDQANREDNMQFNWGYNPLNYNVLEGGYSTDPTDGYVRINEFKTLVQQFNAAGINIIMDVVYNHVNSAIGSNFDVLMPGYFFRYNGDTLSNGSGCGNEFASENPMARKFIVDSTCFWAEEYKLGGFRFDLMGLHDIETMNAVAAALKEINPNIVIYGEPWTGGASTLDASKQAVQLNANNLMGVGQFNDQMRDALIKGGMNGKSAKGWVTNNASVDSVDVKKILAGLQGITLGGVTIADPNRTVNYVTCHDNYTLFDRIMAAGITDEEIVKKMAMLSNAVVLTSNGTSFILAGEEFLRTKQGDENSYQSSYEVNELNYALKVQHQDLFESYKALVAFKQDMAALHLEESEMAAYTATALADNTVIEIKFHDEATGRDYVILHANGVPAEHAADLAGYTLVLDTMGATQLTAETVLNPYQTIIAYK